MVRDGRPTYFDGIILDISKFLGHKDRNEPRSSFDKERSDDLLNASGMDKSRKLITQPHLDREFWPTDLNAPAMTVGDGGRMTCGGKWRRRNP